MLCFAHMLLTWLHGIAQYTSALLLLPELVERASFNFNFNFFTLLLATNRSCKGQRSGHQEARLRMASPY